MSRTILMVTSGKRTTNFVWLKLHGYRVVALKPEFNEHITQLERVLQKGVLAYPDSARADFYDVALEEGEAYIHVFRSRQTVYLVAHSPSTAFSRAIVATKGRSWPPITPMTQINYAKFA